jgi:hypothetical protein
MKTKTANPSERLPFSMGDSPGEDVQFALKMGEILEA